MDAPDLPPLPPLPLGDQGATGPTADSDALRAILRRHRRHQLTTGALALSVVLAAGAAGGFAVGHTTSPASHGVQVAASAPTRSPAAGQSNADNAVGGAITASSAGGTGMSTDLAAPTGPNFSQLLLRDAKDGTRVRLYQQQVPSAKIACPSGSECPTPTMGACAPSSLVSAEVSDDQVAGQTGGAVWGTSPTAPLELVSLGVVGGGQPQPILVVVGRTEPAVANVALTTPYGSDEEAPTAGWVALAVRLPADFAKSGTDGIGSSTLAASDSAGRSLASHALSETPRAVGPNCTPPCIAGGATSSGSVTAPAPAAPPDAKGNALGARADVEVKGGCPFPCPPVGAATGSAAGSAVAPAGGSAPKAGVPNIVMCAPPLGKAPAPVTPPPAGTQGGTPGPTTTTSS